MTGISVSAPGGALFNYNIFLINNSNNAWCAFTSSNAASPRSMILSLQLVRVGVGLDLYRYLVVAGFSKSVGGAGGRAAKDGYVHGVKRS